MDGDKGNEGSENEIDRVTVDEDEARVSYHAERLRATNLIESRKQWLPLWQQSHTSELFTL